MFDSKIMGKRIKELRGTVPQDQCAKELGISRGALSFYENGERKPDAEILYRMSEYFKVSVDYLLGLSDITSADTDVQTACKVTGLNEEAIEALIDEIERWKEFVINDFEMQKYMEIRNSIISTKKLSGIVFECFDLYINSTKCLDFFNFPAEDLITVAEKMNVSDHALIHYFFKQLLPNIEKYPKNEEYDPDRECNLDRYNILKETEKISDMFDRRTEYLEYNEEELLEFFKIDEGTLKQMREQGDNYGECNDSEE